MRTVASYMKLTVFPPAPTLLHWSSVYRLKRAMYEVAFDAIAHALAQSLEPSYNATQIMHIKENFHMVRRTAGRLALATAEAFNC